ncbi:MAG: 2-oxo acid dehydrogenase subunit E2 [Candidatus Dormibacteraeota bacterium]|nr:2-oxo acid dehydrogenase subunit E2 [Candidatus Dormibacteraeota bacterium]
MGVAPIKMPQLGESVTEGTVDKWLKREGDFVKRDEPLVEVVTDKVNAEVPSPFEGTLVKINIGEGTTVAIGTEIAQMEVAGAAPEAQQAAQAATPDSPAEAEPSAAAALATAQETVSEAAAGAARGRLSPAVRRLAEEHGIDPTRLQGSGEGGRVTRDDVLAFLERQEAAPAAAAAPPPARAPAVPVAPDGSRDGSREELVKLSAMRRSIAEHMTRSLATSPHAWTLQEVDVTELVRYREAQKEAFQQRHGAPLTYLPFVVQVVCDALKEFPYLNSSWTEDGILLKRYVNMGLAVSIPDGLIVPVIRDADRLGLSELALTIHDLATRARERQLKPDDVQAGTFTLNNTGATGSVASQPIINQPQAAILTTEAIVRRPVVIGEGIAVRQMMNVCLSFDHRIVDGMMAGQFLGYVRRRLESWSAGDIRI